MHKRTEINTTENDKTIEIINETKICICQKFNKVDKTQASTPRGKNKESHKLSTQIHTR